MSPIVSFTNMAPNNRVVARRAVWSGSAWTKYSRIPALAVSAPVINAAADAVSWVPPTWNAAPPIAPSAAAPSLAAADATAADASRVNSAV